MPKGGKREGAGRKAADPSGEKRKATYFFVTETEAVWLRERLAEHRSTHKKAPPAQP